MGQGLRSWNWRLGLVGALAMNTFSSDCAFSQSNIVADDTLGAERSVVLPSRTVPLEFIRGGAQRGQNLFHSFREFNVNANRGAYFFSPAAIENILARVTGGNPSGILGTLGTYGDSTPNLFLINPNGIIFGPNAKLDVGGSFVATTANAVGLGETGLFSASEPETSTLLAINPDTFFFNQLSNPAEIVNRSTAVIPVLRGFINKLPIANGLQVLEGRSLLLLGGDVRLEGGFLQAPGGRVELGGLSTAGTVGLFVEGNTLSLGFPSEVARADVSLTNRAWVLAGAGGGGNIAINAQTVELLGESLIFTGIETGLGSVDSQAGDIEINATGAITVSESFIGNLVLGIGKGGDIEIITNSLSVTDGAELTTSTFGQGDAGNVRITATGRVSLARDSSNGNSTVVGSQVAPRAEGNGGDVEIITHSLLVTDGARVSANTFGRGDAGSVRITASDTVAFAGVGSNGRESAAFSSVEQGAEGKGGNVEITTNSLFVTDDAGLTASTAGRGDAGNVKITATDTVSFADNSVAFSRVERGGEGNGGDVEITTNSLSVTDGAQLSASTLGQGDAGNVKMTATGTASFIGVGNDGLPSGVRSTVQSGAEGNGGDVEITTNSLSVTDGAQLNASTFGRGDAGNVKITATDIVSFAGVGSNGLFSAAGSQVGLGAEGKGGDVEITTNSLSVADGAQLTASTRGQGDAGNVRIITTDIASFAGVGSNGLSSGVFSTVSPGGEGKGGDVEITSNSLSVTDGAQLAASTLGRGDAGNVRIITADIASFAGVGSNGLSSGVFSAVASGGEGKGGDVEITSNSLSVTDGAQLAASTLGRGDAGNVRIITTDIASFSGLGIDGRSSGASSEVVQGGVGNGGNLEITSNSLFVTDGAQLAASTFGRGNAGNVRITATDTVSFAGVGSDRASSKAISSVAPGAEGNGGNLEISAHSLSVTDGAQLVASTFGRGDAGNVRIYATDTVSFARNSQAFTGVGEGDEGKGGDVEITTNSLSVTDGALLITSTLGRGDAGNVRIYATDIVSFAGNSGAFTTVQLGGEGKGGDVEITSNSLSVTDGARLVAATFGQGDAGNVRITASDSVSFAGVGSNGSSSGAFSSVAQVAKGNGGDIEITSGSLSLTNAFISSDSQGTGTAGNIVISTRQDLQANRSRITATTLSGDGGDMRLSVGDLLLMRDRSFISTTAGQAGTGGDGGNISINADFIVGVSQENSDITANAYQGRGGNINITTQGIYGLEFREQLTPLSDITASSTIGVDGEFQLDLLTNVDPSRGLAQLPTNLVDAARQIDRSCTSGGAAHNSSFVVTGRGGIPSSPLDPLDTDAIVSEWLTLDSGDETLDSVQTDANPSSATPKRIVEAQGWVKTPDGQVILVAQAPTVTPQTAWQTAPSCENVQAIAH